VLVLIDEAGYFASDTTRSLLQRMRLLFQNTPFMLIVAGNPLLMDELIKVEPTFANLIAPNLRIRLSQLTESDVRELIQTRLDKVRPVRLGGTNLEPFTAEAADEVRRQSKGNLRDIVSILHESLEIALDEGKNPIDEGTVLRASKIVLAGKGRDMFSRLKEHEREIVLSLKRSDEDYVAGLAKKLKKKSPTLVEQVKKMRELGYLEVSREEANITYYRLCKPLDQYLSLP
jgi:Cdc6-like AAA superfamily ATPase